MDKSRCIRDRLHTHKLTKRDRAGPLRTDDSCRTYRFAHVSPPTASSCSRSTSRRRNSYGPPCSGYARPSEDERVQYLSPDETTRVLVWRRFAGLHQVPYRAGLSPSRAGEEALSHGSLRVARSYGRIGKPSDRQVRQVCATVGGYPGLPALQPPGPTTLPDTSLELLPSIRCRATRLHVGAKLEHPPSHEFPGRSYFRKLPPK